MVNSVRLSFFFLVLMLAMNPAMASYTEEPVEFESAGNCITGKLILPKDKPGPYPVAVFVHGDGPLPYDAHGYYRFFWNALAEKGIASFSWNKPGIKNSSGDWERQSMHDRAREVQHAISFLSTVEEIDETQIGLIGFSQAGWVIPLAVEDQQNIAFNIVVSGAVNWMRQGNYMTRLRLESNGASQADIEKAIADNNSMAEKLVPSLTYKEFKQLHEQANLENPKNASPLIPESRFEFAKLNWQYDSTESIRKIETPTLFVFGEDDKNVDIDDSIAIYNKELVSGSNDKHKISVYPTAQHGLLKTKYFGEVKPGVWFIVKLEFLGESAFIDNFLGEVVDWAYQHTK